jgi:hypothetical protein
MGSIQIPRLSQRSSEKHTQNYMLRRFCQDRGIKGGWQVLYRYMTMCHRMVALLLDLQGTDQRKTDLVT